MGITAYREYFDFNQTGSDPMKIERINENQIRCTLSNFDLSVRNMNLGELAYGSEKARNLFREMIQRAANEVGFEAEDIPLMVEAIPMANESVMLIITKMEDPEELGCFLCEYSVVFQTKTVYTFPMLHILHLANLHRQINCRSRDCLDY